MKILRQDAARTRKNLLRAAGDVFAEKGYRNATIAEISRRAQTNIAAVNYHFGDKETLYREAWRQSFRDSIAAFPPDGGIRADAPARERLVGQIAALLRRVVDENNREFLIVHRELAGPTGLLEEVMREEMRPLRERILNLMREVLGPGASEREAKFCAISVIGQCVLPALINIAEKQGCGGETDYWKVDDIEAYARHVVAFSLAGLSAIEHKTGSARAGRKTAGRSPAVGGT